MIRPFSEPIYVTRPLLPPLADLDRRLAEVWETRWLTNAGAQHEALEDALRSYLGVAELSLFNNGTIALLTAVKALGLTGEVITTPFTFPATAHALSWMGVTPVFCDIDPVRMTIDPVKAAELITPKTSGILGVHVYGLPCDVDGVQKVAQKHNLTVLYDAAHAFGTTLNGRHIGTFGDVSMFSFHATKLFHTAEGGALACASRELRQRIERLKNFGIVDQEHVETVGINGKMNEMQAALGRCVLECVEEEKQRRKAVADRYRRNFAGLSGVSLLPDLPGVERSQQYFVARFDETVFGASRDQVFDVLKTHNVFARKYFFPLCTDYQCYRDLPSAAPGLTPVARRVVAEVLCLPIYGALAPEAVDAICEIITSIPARI